MLLAAGVALLVSLGGVLGTYSFLTASASAPGGTISSGTAAIQIDNASSVVLGSFSVSPRKPAVRAFKLTNSGDVALDLQFQILAKTTATVQDFAVARVTRVAATGDCVAGLTGEQRALNGYLTGDGFATIAEAESQLYCLEVGLLAGTPIGASGQSLEFVMNVNGTQRGS